MGLVLVEKRPNRRHHDGRTMLEKSQDRKKLTNLETVKGKTKIQNPFDALASVEIVLMADVAGISLGKNDNEVLSSSVEDMDRDRRRLVEFRAQCSTCQVEVGVEHNMNVLGVSTEEEVPVTPHTLPSQPQIEGSPNMPGQWTLVINRKKNQNLGYLMKGVI
jgi:hypothetical protein